MSSAVSKKIAKEKNKQDKNQKKYDNLLKQIDLNIEKEEEKQQNNIEFKQSKLVKNDYSKLNIEDLIKQKQSSDNEDQANDNLEKNNSKINENYQIKHHLLQLSGNNKKKLKEPEAAHKQIKYERQANFEIIKKDVSKWQGVIKQNRESDRLDFASKEKKDLKRVHAIDSKIPKNSFADKIQQKLKSLNLEDEKAVKKIEDQQLKKLQPKEMREKQQEIQKNRSLIFNQELKNKRISKIKSKLYHKLKNKKKIKEQASMLQGASDPSFQNLELEKAQLNYYEERLRLRHSTKNKYAKNLQRFMKNDKQGAQESINELNAIRRNLLRKIESKGDQIGDDISEEYDDYNFREQAIRDLQKELENNEENKDGDQKKSNLGALKFIEKFNEKKNQKIIDETYQLIKQIQENSDIEDLMDENNSQIDSEDEDDEKKKEKNQKKQKQTEKINNFEGRMTFTKEEDKNEKNEEKSQKNQQKQNKNLNPQKILKQYINQQRTELNQNQEDNDNIANLNNDINQKRYVNTNIIDQNKLENKNKNKKVKQTENQAEQQVQNTNQNQKQEDNSQFKYVQLQKDIDEKNIANGINIENLKQKYSKNLNLQFEIDQFKKFGNDGEDNKMIDELQNFNQFNTNENQDDFLQEKLDEYQQDLPKEGPSLKGWGSWTGQGVQEKKISEEEKLKKKLEQINELKKQRKDGNLSHVIINEQRNKGVVNYLVNKIPYNFANKDQFNYLNDIPLGSEWNTSQHFKQINQSRIHTKKGEIINPITLPKNQKQKQNL